MDATLRRATAADAQAIGDLVTAATAELWGTQPDEPETEHRTAQTWQNRLDSDRFEVFVAELEGELVGEVAVTPTHGVPKSAHLSSIAVRPDAWGRGLARRLLDHATGHLRRNGFEVVECWTEADNERSLRLYGSDGWTRIEGACPEHEGGRRLVHLHRPL